MNYAIAEISGKQIWVEKGKFYDVNKIKLEVGSKITLNRILLVNEKNNIFLGKPYLAVIPGLAIMSLVMAFMLIGNTLRDALDVKT